MSTRRLKLSLFTVAIMAGSVGFNLMVMQPSGGRGARPERAYRGLDTLPGAASTQIKPQAAKPARETLRDQASHALVPAPGAPEAALAPPTSASTTRAVQSALHARGYYPDEADGVAGIVTRAAIMDFEHLNGLPLTAEATVDLVKVLASASSRDILVRAAVPRENVGTAGAEAEIVIRTVQRSLDRLGYTPGTPDGKLGEATAAAIRAFEQDNAMDATGRISAALVVRLAGRTGAGRLAANE